MNNKILQVSLGVSMVLFAAGFFMRSLSTAKAAPLPQPAAGKYQMAISGQNIVNVLAWNTETGQSRLYVLEYRDHSIKVYPAQLPANPLGN